MIKLHRKNRSSPGAAIAEFSAAIVLLVPLFMVVVYVMYAISMYMYLKSGIDAAARTEARWLAINFNYLVQRNGNSTANYANWKNSKVRIANCLVDDMQFTNGTIDSAGNFVTTPPQTQAVGSCLPTVAGQGVVAVKATYPALTGLPDWPFPPVNFWGAQIVPNRYVISSIYCVDIEP